MAKWKVNDGTQVFLEGSDKRYVGGDTFEATEERITAEGLTGYVTKAESAAKKPEAKKETEKAVSPAAPPAANKAVAAPTPREPVPTFDVKPAPKTGK